MNKNPKNKKIILFFLCLIAVLIWGSNGYRILKGVAGSGETTSLSIIKTSNITEQKIDSTWFSWQYPAAKRDPFVPIRKKINRSQNMTNSPDKKEDKSPPKIRIKGIIKDEKGEQVIIEDSKRFVHFVQCGETLDSLKVLSVKGTIVYVLYKGNKFEFELNDR